MSGQTSVTYDPAGNLTHDVNGHAYVYDGENKQTTYDGGASANGGATYSYDGDGRRVKKVVGGSPMTSTVFVYDIQSQLVAEYSDAQPTTTGGTSYLTEDTLGTPRVDTDASGNVRARHDYQPFGEELYAGFGSRTTPNGYVTDNVNQKFTSRERDIETGLDFFGARYYTSTQGRFTSADPVVLKKVRLTDPQRLNLFTYARNNPQKYIDPTGEDIHVALTNTVTGTATIHSETSTERRNNPKGVDRTDTVNAYKMTITNDSGTKYTFSVTRDSNRNGAADQMRGNYGIDNEAPPGSYRGTWEHSNNTGWHIRVYDPNVDNGGNNTIVAPDGTRRTDIEIHVGTCSEGCPLVRGNSTEGEDKSYKDAMDALIKEDRDNKKGTDIYVNIQDRNPNGQPLDEPDIPETVNGTMIITRPPDSPRRRPE